MPRRKPQLLKAQMMKPIKLIKASSELVQLSPEDWEAERRESVFLIEYLKDFNAGRAAMAAGYTENVESARAIACKMLKKPRIAKIVREQMDARLYRANITADRILRELHMIATADVSQAFDERGDLLPIHKIPEAVRRCISGFDVERPISRPGDKITKVKFWSKSHAIETIARHLRLLVDRVETEDLRNAALEPPVVHETFVESREELQSSPGMGETADGQAAQHPVPGEIPPA